MGRLSRSSLAFLLGILFAVQVLVAVPQHQFHGGEHAVKVAAKSANVAGENGRGKGSSLPDDCRCDFCLAFSGLDTGSVVVPPVRGLAETSFSVVAAYASFEYSHPSLFALARGPPRFAA